MYQTLILCSAPRSGSTMLCDLLSGTGVAGEPHSFFRRQSITEYRKKFGLPPEVVPGIDQPYLEAVVRAGTGETGMFGLRLMWETLAELSAALDGMFPRLAGGAARLERAFGRILYLHLTRTDKVAQAVSLVKAQQTGLWHRYANGEERERTAPPKPPQYDRALLAEQIAALEASDAGWTDWFAAEGISPIRVTYEALGADPRSELAKVLRALGQNVALAERASIVSGKLANAESVAWAERYRREVSS